jgi:hypothetical protein
MTLAELQATVDEWIRRNGGYWDKFQILARLTEELGKTASALQRQEGLRPRKVEADLGGKSETYCSHLRRSPTRQGLISKRVSVR